MGRTLCYATIRDTCSRATWWREVFDGLTVPIRGPVTTRVRIEGLGERDAYLLDVAALPPATFERLVAHVVRQFCADPTEARSSLRRDGMPILADDVTVSFDALAVM